MAFKQYTHCTPSGSFDKAHSDNMSGKVIPAILGIGGLLAMIHALFFVAAIPVFGIALVLAGGGVLYVQIVNTFEYLLGGKLICLGGDKLAIGKVLGVELPPPHPSSGKTGISAMDNDLSINVLLCPHEKIIDDSTRKWEPEDLPDIDVANKKFQDDLIIEQAASSNHGVPYTGYCEKAPFKFKPVLHVELEGSKIYDLYQAFKAAWAILLLAALLAAALLAAGVIGLLLALILMFLAGIIGAGIVVGMNATASDGSLNDVAPEIGELHVNDVIVTYGTWTYDAGHNADNVGWYELHPVKYLSKAEHCADEKEAKDWEEKIKETFNPVIRVKQKNRQNQWKLHPQIDGCNPKNNEEPVIN